MSNNSKIQITCDLCGKICSTNKIMEIRFMPSVSWLEIYPPSLGGENFACHDCLERIGWKDEKSEETEKPADTPNAAGSSNNTSPAI